MRARIASRRVMLSSIPVAVVIIPLLIVSPIKNLSDQYPHRHESKTRQIDPETSCGPVSLAVVSEYLGQPGTIAQFHRATNAGILGVCSIKDLLRAAHEHGLAATAVRYDPRRPPTHRLPMILFVDGHHFLTAIPGRGGDLVLVDPPSEPSSAPWSSLDGRWRGEAVVLGRAEAEVRTALAGN